MFEIKIIIQILDLNINYRRYLGEERKKTDYFLTLKNDLLKKKTDHFLTFRFQSRSYLTTFVAT